MPGKTEVANNPIHVGPETCKARFVLEHVAAKWSLYVVAVLGDGERRFTEIKRTVDGISQRMLTVTLRGLERDGLVTRTIYSAMPPNIAYRLTPFGETLLEAAAPLIAWATDHLPDIEAARNRFEQLAGQ